MDKKIMIKLELSLFPQEWSHWKWNKF